MNTFPSLPSLGLMCLILSLTSCGPSKQELNEKRMADSLRKAQIQAEIIADRELAQHQKHQQSMQTGATNIKLSLTELRNDISRDLLRKEKQLAEAKKFKLGRSKKQKERTIQSLNQEISYLRSTDRQLNYLISSYRPNFEGNGILDPYALIDFVQNVARNGGNSELNSLIDPYGNTDKSGLYICLLDLLPEKSKQRFIIQYRNISIESTNYQNGGTATIRIKVGASSSYSEEWLLANRGGSWYLLEVKPV
ncbi:hypothetical protein [Pontibacter sp. G13]|uniref:hypothetical protein n=1 Tax=Pontibacter sp. G13 TaxID=3074898 RepID=UPI002889A2E9|nr:hypothetical protein [Pontibacter sp. G13]WNJ19916.1 hypothetical protein RJD25_05485 [Pontibacter sp. G13]